jgi:hypothetical protein
LKHEHTTSKQKCLLLEQFFMSGSLTFNPLNTELNPICRLLALLGAHHILHVSRIRVNLQIFSAIQYLFFFSDFISRITIFMHSEFRNIKLDIRTGL